MTVFNPCQLHIHVPVSEKELTESDYGMENFNVIFDEITQPDI